MFKKPKRPSLIKTNQINMIRQFAEVTISAEEEKSKNATPLRRILVPVSLRSCFNAQHFQARFSD